MTSKDKNRKLKNQLKIRTSETLPKKVKNINKEINIEKNLNQLNGLNMTKIVNTCLNLYVTDVNFQKKVIDIILKGE